MKLYGIIATSYDAVRPRCGRVCEGEDGAQMTIDERVAALSGSRMSTTNEAFERRLRLAFLEVARDQRHACADSLTTLQAKPDVGYIDWNEAHQAVMNAEIK